MRRSSAAFFLSLLILMASPILRVSSAEPIGTGVLLVAEKGNQSLGIVQGHTKTAEIAEGGVTGHEVIASPDGRLAFVPIYGNSGVGKPGTDGRKIAVIDLKTRQVSSTIDFDHGIRPHCPVFGPKDGLLYVTTELDKTITVIDPKSLKIVGAIPTGQPESHMLAISPDGRRGYTANVGPGTVSVLDLRAHKVLKIIPVSKQTQRISVSPDGKMIFTSDQTKPQLAVISAASNKVKSWITLPGTGYGTAPTPDGKWLVVAVPSVNKVVAIDLTTLQVAHAIDVPSSPQEVLVRPDGKIAYVSCDRSNQVAAIRVDDWQIEKLIDTGKGADGLAWAVE